MSYPTAVPQLPAGQTPSEDAPSYTIEALTAAAADTLRVATALGRGTPTAVTVTAQGVAAVMPVEAMLGWQTLWDHSPTVESYDGSPFLALWGLISGAPWRLHNGVALPAERRPWRHEAPAPVSVDSPRGQFVPVGKPRRPRPAPPVDAEIVDEVPEELVAVEAVVVGDPAAAEAAQA